MRGVFLKHGFMIISLFVYVGIMTYLDLTTDLSLIQLCMKTMQYWLYYAFVIVLFAFLLQVFFYIKDRK